jgi:hypothetical protein
VLNRCCSAALADREGSRRDVAVKVRTPQAQGEFANDSAIELVTGSQRRRTQAGASAAVRESVADGLLGSTTSSLSPVRQLSGETGLLFQKRLIPR